MPFLTPYSPSDSGLSIHTINVAWKLSGHRSGPVEQVAAHSTGSSGSTLWVTSLIECRHPEGKLWRSMFIPLTATGGLGMSITWWGKDDTVKGQTQCKIVSEQEWYTVVKSKAVGKGYNVENYIGRSVPLAVGHGFVSDLVADKNLPQLPGLAFTTEQANDLIMSGGSERLGMKMGKALANILPTSNFFANLNGKGHSLNALLSQGYAEAGSLGEKDVVAGLMIELTGVVKPTEATVPSEPQVDREEVYGSGWGAFG